VGNRRRWEDAIKICVTKLSLKALVQDAQDRAQQRTFRHEDQLQTNYTYIAILELQQTTVLEYAAKQSWRALGHTIK
jgi:hypothetical protein